MIDLRLWRIALLSVPLAVVIAMFSLHEESIPIQGGIPPDAFDSGSATPLAKELAQAAPNPRPGSDSDQKLADRVKSSFSSIPGATVAEQEFDAAVHGEDVELRNLIATLPGDSDRQIALIAPRDVETGSGAVTSIAATAAMLEIANSFSGSSHRKTLVFVSTDGSSVGALGARRFVRDYSDSDLLDAAIVLSQPAVPDRTPPLVIPWSTGPTSTSAQLDDTANSTVSKEADTPAGDEGPIDDLFRLALPSALGEQGPLIEAGLPAIRISSDGELPVEGSQDSIDQFGTDSFTRLGRASLSLILALDASDGGLDHGPRGYIGVGGNLLPGWTIGLLALALLLPVALASGAGLASAAHSPIEAVRGVVWTGLRSVPFLGALAAFSAAVLVGLMPSPDFPFDPRIEELGTGGTLAVVGALLSYCVIAFFMRPLRPPPRSAVSTAAPAAVLVACAVSLAIWIVNPYMGLLVALALQAWLLAASRVGGGSLVAAGLVLGGLIPLAALLADLAGRFDAGFGVWHDLLLMVADGQIGFVETLLGCLLAGCGVAIVAVAGHGPEAPPPEPMVEGEISVRRREAGAGSTGETDPQLAEEEPAERDEEAEPAQPEPERDPRLWSKPRGVISPPPGSRRATPWPSVT